MKFKTIKRIHFLLVQDVMEKEKEYEQARENYRFKKNQMNSDWDSDAELEYLRETANKAHDALLEAKDILDEFEEKEWN